MNDAARGPIEWDKDKIVAALLGRQAKGRGLNTGAIQKSGLRLAAAIWGHFGTHDAALRAAGVDPDAVRLSGRPWDKGRIIAALRERRDKGLGVNDGALWRVGSGPRPRDPRTIPLTWSQKALCARERRVLKYALRTGAL